MSEKKTIVNLVLRRVFASLPSPRLFYRKTYFVEIKNSNTAVFFCHVFFMVYFSGLMNLRGYKRMFGVIKKTRGEKRKRCLLHIIILSFPAYHYNLICLESYYFTKELFVINYTTGKNLL